MLPNESMPGNMNRLHGRVLSSRYDRLGRGESERNFGHSGNLGMGFKGLPPRARRKHRVERWMWGKILLYHTHPATEPYAV